MLIFKHNFQSFQLMLKQVISKMTVKYLKFVGIKILIKFSNLLKNVKSTSIFPKVVVLRSRQFILTSWNYFSIVLNPSFPYGIFKISGVRSQTTPNSNQGVVSDLGRYSEPPYVFLYSNNFDVYSEATKIATKATIKKLFKIWIKRSAQAKCQNSTFFENEIGVLHPSLDDILKIM